MLEKKPKDEGLDLSEMIDEYDEDNELRKKIEAMKQGHMHDEKEQPSSDMTKETPEGEASVPENQAETKETAVPDQTMEMPKFNDHHRQSSFIDADVESTKVMNSLDAENETDNDKTLVIMNGSQRIYRDQDTALDHDSALDQADGDKDQESVYLYENHDIDEEEITEEDIEESLGEEKPKSKKPMDPKKMNKIVTYVIAGIVVICIVVAAGFGVKALIDHNSDSEDPATNEPAPEKPEDKPKDPVVKDPQSSSKDNSKRIGEINGLIKEYQSQIDELKDTIAKADDEIAEAEAAIVEAEDTIGDSSRIDLSTKCENQKFAVNTAKETLDGIIKDVGEDPKNEKYVAAKKNYDDAIKAQENYCSAFEIVNSATNAITNAEKKKTDANARKGDCLDKITELQEEIQKLQNERDSLK